MVQQGSLTFNILIEYQWKFTLFQTLQSMLKKILEQAMKQGMTSIAIPAIGTGNLNFPRDVTARVMYETVADFSKDNPTSALNDIRFWVYDKDIQTVQVSCSPAGVYSMIIQRLCSPVPYMMYFNTR